MVTITASLPVHDVERFHRDGVIGAYPALKPDEVTRLRERLEAFETRMGATLGNLPGQIRAKTHLLFPWMNQLVRNANILDAVESILGKNLLVYHVTCWLKGPGDGFFVTWHQDGAYFNLAPPEHVTAWLALSDATEQFGCMRFIPGSHTAGALTDEVGHAKNNLLSNGQQVPGIDGAGAVAVPVPVGHFSLHHTHILHASGPNNASDRRIGIGISYIPTHVRFTGNTRVTATRVRGVDTYGHFDAEDAPGDEYDEKARAHHRAAIARFFEAHGSTRAANA